MYEAHAFAVTHPRRRPRPARTVAAVALTLAAALAAPGCHSKAEKRPTPNPGPTYTGPQYLRGTVGSMCRFRNTQPLYVSGYGMVVGLHGTGSPEVPSFLKDWLIREMKKKGLGSSRLGTEKMTPSRVLADEGSSVVAVEGFIPPGAVKGTTFDVLVSAIDTQTTSLGAGTLWTTDLSIGGTNRSLSFTRPLASANGSIYVNPFNAKGADEEAQSFRRQAIVVGGGLVTESRPIELVLNAPSYGRAAAIADRINERFPKAPAARRDAAEPLNDLVIRLNIPDDFAEDPGLFVSLVEHLYVQAAPDFVPLQATRLGKELARDPDKAPRVLHAWRALGKAATASLREFYADEDPALRSTAIEAGAYLQDPEVTGPLQAMAGDDDPATRVRAAEALAFMPRDLRSSHTLSQLLDDDDTGVRIAAYEALARRNDPLIERVVVGSERSGVKFIIDRIPVQKPLVYITQQGIPRIAIFNPQLGFRAPMLARMWNNRLILRSATTIPQAVAGFDHGETAYIPVYSRGPMVAADGQTVTRVFDNRDGSAFLRIDRPEDAERFEELVPTQVDVIKSGRAKRAAIAVVRVVDQSEEGTRLSLIRLIEGDQADIPLTLYYASPYRRQSETLNIVPTLATLAYILAHSPTMDRPQKGLGLSYGEVVDAVYHLCTQNYVQAPVELNISPLAQRVADEIDAGPGDARPETAEDPDFETLTAPGPAGESASRPESSETAG